MWQERPNHLHTLKRAGKIAEMSEPIAEMCPSARVCQHVGNTSRINTLLFTPALLHTRVHASFRSRVMRQRRKCVNHDKNCVLLETSELAMFAPQTPKVNIKVFHTFGFGSPHLRRA